MLKKLEVLPFKTRWTRRRAKLTMTVEQYLEHKRITELFNENTEVARLVKRVDELPEQPPRNLHPAGSDRFGVDAEIKSNTIRHRKRDKPKDKP